MQYDCFVQKKSRKEWRERVQLVAFQGRYTGEFAGGLWMDV